MTLFRIQCFLFVAFFVSIESIYAVVCLPVSPEEQVASTKHIFVARVVEALYKDSPGARGTVFGTLDPVETLKGNPAMVTAIRKTVRRPGSPHVGGESDLFPVGLHVIVFSNGEDPYFGGCSFTRIIEYVPGESCTVDPYRRVLGIEHPDTEVCMQIEDGSLEPWWQRAAELRR